MLSTIAVRVALPVALLAVVFEPVLAQESERSVDSGRAYTPDLRDTDIPAAAAKGNFVIAPIPFSNPTFDTGLILGAGYFYPQTAEQAAVQPASVTGAGVMYAQNGSNGAAVGHSGYFREDRWRFSGAYGYADLELPLLALDPASDLLDIDWFLDARLLSAQVSRRVGKNWYAGASLLQVDVDQKFQVSILSQGFDLIDSFTSAGVGVTLSYDTRDMPTNPYAGRYLKISSLFNRDSFGSDLVYDAYSVAFRSYHPLSDSFVLAWEIKACGRSDGTPLWDACKLGLRGFASTDYMGKRSLSAQTEGRWRFAQRWGVVGFVGSGTVDNTLSGVRENDWVPSYGAGLRFTIQQEKRINLRLDYARSRDSDAVSFFVGEAF